MEVIDQERPRVYDPDLDDDKPNNEGGEDAAPKKQEEPEKKKKERKPLLKLDPTFVTENPRGLKRLYQHVVIDAEKNLQFKGRGHEVSDFNRVMKVLRGWHFEAMPKLEV